MAVTHIEAVRNGIADHVVDQIDAGVSVGNLVIRAAGSAAGPGTAIATLPCSATAFGAASSGIASSNAFTSDSSAVGGTAATATFEDSSANVVTHCAVAASGSDINLSSVTISAGDSVTMGTVTYTAPL